MKPLNNISLPAEEIPIIADVDVAVIGGSFAGISSALEFANQGKKVIVVESRTYLGSELTATNRPWIEMDDKGVEQLPDIIKSTVDECGIERYEQQRNYIVFQVDQLKRHLEDRLINAGIKLLYATLPIGITTDNHASRQLMIANKSGRQVIQCEQIIDTTSTALASFLCRQPAEYTKEEAYYRCVVELDKVQSELNHAEIILPSNLGLKDNMVSIYKGFHGNGHLYVSFYLRLPAGNTLEDDEVRETHAKKTGMHVAKYLIQQEQGYNKALLCSISNELEGPFPLDFDLNASNEMDPKSWKVENITLDSSGIGCFYNDFYTNGNTDWLDPVKAVRLAESYSKMAEQMVRTSKKQPAEITFDEPYDIRIPTNLLDQCSEKTKVNREYIPYHKETKVLVAGGGSSGATAAITAASEGMDTTLIDLNPGLGGTGTFGGVDSYWFGNIKGYSKRLQNEVSAVEREINHRGGKWNIEAKKHTLLTQADQIGVHLMFNAITFGAIMEKNKVSGVVVATKWGVCSITADRVIDATGDGDIAVFAGADYTYGSARDHVVMWYSLAQFKKPGRLQNNFTSMVNVADIEDYTRAIMVGRRRDKDKEYHDHGIYIATRESRHITGDITMTITDQLLHRNWPDVINIHFSNHDMKGVSHADWLNTGLIPPNLDIEIPFRMLLPKGIEGILVAGKAISATHDAFPSIRMQADLENLGAIVGIAAVESIKEDIFPRQLNIKKLQKRIVQEGLLPEEVIERKEESLRYSDKDMRELVDSIEIEEPLYEYSRMKMNEVYRDKIIFAEICTAGPRIVPILLEAHEQATGIRKVRLAQALAMYENKAAVPTLINEINSMLQGNELPKRTANILYVTTPPDHGAMPDVCYLLYSLGMTKDKRSLPIWQSVAELISTEAVDFEDPWWGMFYYVHAVCYAAEKQAVPTFIPILEKLHKNPLLSNQSCYSGVQSDYFLERRSMLELSIGRALARCGSHKGYRILINYLRDVRSLLRKQAHSELTRLHEQSSLGNNPALWLKWLEEQRELPIKPYTERPDLNYISEEITRNML